MIKNKEDMRIVKTKKAIEDAFFSLMEKMPFEKISIKDICTAAMIGNATFYYHYNDKQDLAEQLTKKYLSELRSTILWQLSIMEGGQSALDAWNQIAETKKSLSRRRSLLLKIHSENFDFEYETLAMFQELVMFRCPQGGMSDEAYALKIEVTARQLMCFFRFVEDTGKYLSYAEFFSLGQNTLIEYYGAALPHIQQN